MGIFKRTKKYSKPSKDLDKKIKNLDEGLKKTNMISSEGGEEIVEEVVSSFGDGNVNVDDIDENKSSWRDSFDPEELCNENTVEFTEEPQRESKNLGKFIETKLGEVDDVRQKVDEKIDGISEIVESFEEDSKKKDEKIISCLLYTSPSPRD